MSKQDIEKRLGFAAQDVKATFAEFNVGDKVVATPNNHIDAYGRIIKIENGIATIASAEGNVKAKLSDLELVKKGSVEDLRRIGMKGFARPGVKAEFYASPEHIPLILAQTRKMHADSKKAAEKYLKVGSVGNIGGAAGLANSMINALENDLKNDLYRLTQSRNPVHKKAAKEAYAEIKAMADWWYSQYKKWTASRPGAKAKMAKRMVVDTITSGNQKHELGYESVTQSLTAGEPPHEWFRPIVRTTNLDTGKSSEKASQPHYTEKSARDWLKNYASSVKPSTDPLYAEYASNREKISKMMTRLAQARNNPEMRQKLQAESDKLDARQREVAAQLQKRKSSRPGAKSKFVRVIYTPQGSYRTELNKDTRVPIEGGKGYVMVDPAQYITPKRVRVQGTKGEIEVRAIVEGKEIVGVSAKLVSARPGVKAKFDTKVGSKGNKSAMIAKNGPDADASWLAWVVQHHGEGQGESVLGTMRSYSTEARAKAAALRGLETSGLRGGFSRPGVKAKA